MQGRAANEVVEALGVAIFMNGGPSTVYGPRAFDVVREFADARDASHLGSVGVTALDRFRLDGKVALIAGAGRGIGAASALALADAGADVAALSRTVTQIDAVAEQARSFGGRAIAIPTDASDAAAVEAAVARTVEEFGRLDVVISVVGGSYPKPFLATS